MRDEEKLEYLRNLHQSAKLADSSACTCLALGVIERAKKDIFWESYTRVTSRTNAEQYEEQKRKALIWVFSENHEKTFFFWCSVARLDPEAVRYTIKKDLVKSEDLKALANHTSETGSKDLKTDAFRL
jgi:hypothetical protein